MDLEIIEILYKFGKIFALTPPSSKRKKLNHLQRYYSFLIFALYLVGVTIHNYNVISYHTVLSPSRLTLTIYIFIYNCMVQFYILIIVMGLHRKRWFTLIQNLRNVKIPRNHNTVYFIMLSSSLLTYLSMEFLDSFRLINYFGLYEFALAIPAHFEKLSQFFYTICACVVLKMVLSRYQHHTTMLLHVTKICKHPNPTQLKPALKNLKRTLFVLKRTVDAFNDLFGWTFLSTILCGVTRILFSYRLETMLSSYEKKEIQVFIDVVTYNRPKFKAARFFSVDRSTLFSVLNSLTTFLLVMIQFKEI
ncbi:unnamed protein product [Tenebrio molitor]|nr:unnamed protein product [Tenebrio molitor]